MSEGSSRRVCICGLSGSLSKPDNRAAVVKATQVNNRCSTGLSGNPRASARTSSSSSNRSILRLREKVPEQTLLCWLGKLLTDGRNLNATEMPCLLRLGPGLPDEQHDMAASLRHGALKGGGRHPAHVELAEA